MFPLISLFVIVALSLIITRIAAMALMATGLSRDAVRFQVRSAFTGAGFTTSEAESVVNHPVRRRIVMSLMLLGNIGIATVIATVVLTFVTSASSGHGWRHALFLFSGIAVLSLLSVNRRLELYLNRWIARGLKKWTRLDVTDYVAVLQLQNGYAVGELNIEPRDWLAGKTLSETALSREGVLVLGIQRADEYIGAPRAADLIQAGDVLILYASAARIAELDQRIAGAVGERAHQEAMLEQQSRRGETNRDPAPAGIAGVWRHMLHPFRERHSPAGTSPREQSPGQETSS